MGRMIWVGKSITGGDVYSMKSQGFVARVAQLLEQRHHVDLDKFSFKTSAVTLMQRNEQAGKTPEETAAELSGSPDRYLREMNKNANDMHPQD